MISDSAPWREELIRVADRLEKRTTQRRWSERTSYLIERDVMLSAYSIRKLQDAGKVSDALTALCIPVERFELVGKTPDVYNQEFWKSFNLTKPTAARFTLRQLCNQIIHSFVFVNSVTEEDTLWDGIFVASDTERKKNLYKVGAVDLIKLFHAVGHECIISMDLRRNKDGERMWTNLIGVDMRSQPDA